MEVELYTEEERADFRDLKKQISNLLNSDELDMDGDGAVDIIHLPLIMTLLGEPKCPPEKLEDIKESVLEEADPPGSTRIPLTAFLEKVKMKLDSYGSMKEFIEAFKIFDEDGSGMIPINSFRFFVLKYAQMEPAEMDDMICDILDLKKIAPIDSAVKVDYAYFADKLFNKDFKKRVVEDPKKKGKGGKSAAPKKR